jgi:dTMP kinase
MTNGQRGLFIAFEGGEGSGKTTQAGMLKEYLTLQHSAILTREPGGTIVGATIRKMLLNRDETPFRDPKAEALLFAADRAEHVSQVIKPALDKGVHVVCDRYSASTVAYQSYANGLRREQVENMSDWASGGLRPDITFFLDIPPAVGLKRAAQRSGKTHFEDKDLEYHQKVRKGFLAQRNASWISIDAEDSLDAISRTIIEHMTHVIFVLGEFAKIREPEIVNPPAFLLGSDGVFEKVETAAAEPPTPRFKAYPCYECGEWLTMTEDQHDYSCLRCGKKHHTNPEYYCTNCKKPRVPYALL